MTNMTNEQFSRQWEIARRICNYKIQGLLKPTITGGAAIDTYLKRECKDFDVYFPECLLQGFDADHFCNELEINSGSLGSHADITNTSQEYGECTLRYVIKGVLLDAPVHIEIITWKPREGSCYNDTDYIGAFISGNYTQTDMCTAITGTFSVNTSMAYFLGTSDNELVLQVPCTIMGYNSPLRSVEVYDLTSKLMDKSLVKYDQYCRQTPAFYDDEEKALRAKSLTLHSTKHSYTKLNNSLVRISSYPYDYVEGSLEQAEPKPYDRRDTPVSTDITTWNMSRVRERDTAGTSVFGSRPQGWVSESRVTQELQSIRVQASRVNQEVRFDPTFIWPAPAQPREPVVIRPAPSFAAPRPPDF